MNVSVVTAKLQSLASLMNVTLPSGPPDHTPINAGGDQKYEAERQIGRMKDRFESVTTRMDNATFNGYVDLDSRPLHVLLNYGYGTLGDRMGRYTVSDDHSSLLYEEFDGWRKDVVDSIERDGPNWSRYTLTNRDGRLEASIIHASEGPNSTHEYEQWRFYGLGFRSSELQPASSSA